MSSFTTPLRVELLDDYKFKVIEPFKYYTTKENKHKEYIVPDGFVTDFASIPRFLWGILPPHGKYAKSAVLHDYMYEKAIGSKEEADTLFYESMLVLGVNPRIAYIMYHCVKRFGKGKYPVKYP